MKSANKSILITGVCGGMGKSIAQKFLNNGSIVYGIDIKNSLPENLKNNRSFFYQNLDIADASGVSDFFQKSDTDFQLIVNCAGILKLKNSLQASSADWESTIGVNLTGSFYLAKFGVQYFRDKNMKGTIIFIGSRWGSSGTDKDCSYAASKAGLKGFVKSLQIENLSTGIRCILVSPGSVLTNMSRSVDNAVEKNILQTDDISELILYISQTSPNVIFDEISIKAFPYDYINL